MARLGPTQTQSQFTANPQERLTKLKTTLTVIGAFTLSLVSAGVFAQTVGVSWSNFQEERGKADEATLKAPLEKSGTKYISADAALSRSTKRWRWRTTPGGGHLAGDLLQRSHSDHGRAHCCVRP
jgi:hypothetical protein